MEQTKFFARKIDPNTSKELLISIENIYFSGIKIEKSDTNTSIKLIIEYLKSKCTPDIKDGLYFGNIGVLILFVHYSILQKNNNLISDLDIKQLLSYVINEFSTTKDTSYETGRMGLIIGLEYLYGLLGNEYIADEITDELNDINSTKLNYITNFYDTHSDKQLYLFKIYNSYFKAREYANRMTVMDKGVWKYIKQKVTIPRYEDKDTLYSQINRYSPIGLKGYAGNGLWLLSELYSLKTSEWTFLIV